MHWNHISTARELHFDMFLSKLILYFFCDKLASPLARAPKGAIYGVFGPFKGRLRADWGDKGWFGCVTGTIVER